MNHKDMAEGCIKALEEKVKALSSTSSTVLDALMVLYMDIDKHADDYKYGRADAGSAWKAVYNFMQFQDDLAHLEQKLHEVRWSVQAMSDGLYDGREEQ
jgi:outer membrane murein-binding lipoprotein Lpp